MTVYEALEIAEQFRCVYEGQNRQIKEALYVLIDALTWKPMDDAPRDGRSFLARWSNGVSVVCWPDECPCPGEWANKRGVWHGAVSQVKYTAWLEIP